MKKRYNEPMIIETTQKLKEVCHSFQRQSYMTIDTEFIREKTFYPVLCLVQIANEREAYCIDPLAKDMDLTPLFDLLQDKNVVKVFHAARQDIEIFYHLTGHVPSPLFDTQIGAMVLGYGENVSYQQLVHAYTGITLDKSQRFTDWSRRPLTSLQEEYGLCDVTHLCVIYEKMQEELKKTNRLSWLETELSVLNDPQTYDPDESHLLTKIRTHLTKPLPVHVYEQLYIWRENKAKEKNRPRRHILKDDILTELAALHPTTLEKLSEMRGLPQNYERSSQATELIAVIQKAVADDPALYTKKIKKRELKPSQKNLMELLKLLLNIVADQERVASRLIADTDDLILLIQDEKNARCLKDWRRDLFGEKALKLKSGHLSFGYDPVKRAVCLIETQ